jgi:hypothetical protein
MFTNSSFLRNATSVGTRWLIVPFTRSKEVKEVALNVRGNEVCYFSRLIGNWESQDIQPIRNKENVKTDSDWSESFLSDRWKLEAG